MPALASWRVRSACWRTLARASLSLAFDPAATLAARGSLARSVDDTFEVLLAVFAAMCDAGIDGRLIVADGRPWHDGGASEAQELAAVLAATVACLRQAEARGLELSSYARRLGVLLAADADQFVTIAKFRAMRLLLARVFELAGLPEATVRVDAETSWRMMARRDPYLNMLRTSAAAFAAATGGADSVTVLPFDLGGEAFAERMARNIQTISLDEAALFRVGDPGAGSGAIEALTAELARTAWDAFRAIEAEGGLPAAVRSGTIQARIAAKRDERFGKVARREIELVGVNVHVDRGQPLAAARSLPCRALSPDPDAAETAAPLEPARLAEPFERLCDKAERLAASGRRPTRLHGLPRPASRFRGGRRPGGGRSGGRGHRIDALLARIRDTGSGGGVLSRFRRRRRLHRRRPRRGGARRRRDGGRTQGGRRKVSACLRRKPRPRHRRVACTSGRICRRSSINCLTRLRSAEKTGRIVRCIENGVGAQDRDLHSENAAAGAGAEDCRSGVGSTHGRAGKHRCVGVKQPALRR